MKLENSNITTCISYCLDLFTVALTKYLRLDAYKDKMFIQHIVLELKGAVCLAVVRSLWWIVSQWQDCAEEIT